MARTKMEDQHLDGLGRNGILWLSRQAWFKDSGDTETNRSLVRAKLEEVRMDGTLWDLDLANKPARDILAWAGPDIRAMGGGLGASWKTMAVTPAHITRRMVLDACAIQRLEKEGRVLGLGIRNVLFHAFHQIFDLDTPEENQADIRAILHRVGFDFMCRIKNLGEPSVMALILWCGADPGKMGRGDFVAVSAAASERLMDRAKWVKTAPAPVPGHKVRPSWDELVNMPKIRLVFPKPGALAVKGDLDDLVKVAGIIEQALAEDPELAKRLSFGYGKRFVPGLPGLKDKMDRIAKAKNPEAKQ